MDAYLQKNAELSPTLTASLPPFVGTDQSKADADYNRKTVTPQRNPGPFQPPVRLALQAQAVPAHYAVVTRWEERRLGEVTRTIIDKHLAVALVPQGTGWRLTLTADPPALRKPDLTPLEEIMLLLAALYQKLELKMSVAGRRIALLNHAEIQHTWGEIKQTLAAQYGEQDELTTLLRDGLAAQVQQPENIMTSLTYDYAYALLLKNIYQQRFESDLSYEQGVGFPQFFANTDLYFHERMTLAPPPAPGRVLLTFGGPLDEQRTNRAAVARQVAALLHPDGAPADCPPLDPAGLEFAYSATYDVDAATGWPVSIGAVVTCRYPAADFAKEYDLTIERL